MSLVSQNPDLELWGQGSTTRLEVVDMAGRGTAVYLFWKDLLDLNLKFFFLSFPVSIGR